MNIMKSDLTMEERNVIDFLIFKNETSKIYPFQKPYGDITIKEIDSIAKICGDRSDDMNVVYAACEKILGKRELSIEERINNIFKALDNYANTEGLLNELTIDWLISVKTNFADTRRQRMVLNMQRDEAAYQLEKDIAWLISVMRERNLEKVTR